MLAVYERLERYVRKYPDQWLKWREFDGMVAG